ncbi:unnamed protein product [Heligmosomoides polygyrus]|uniref:Probable arginine--tRNA ligase, cytoplasmic n=1 Tax=Heligmosomoides polygyrus TaxID=6339 RepID=A0A3P8AX61_HELPZ|nr:unnamed protein product [Heligmosomoides polygyrus]
MERIASAMRRGEVTEDVLEVCPELALSYKQNEKLKYRKIILQRAFPCIECVTVALTETTNPKFGDYQCNSAMALSAKLKASGTVMRPNEVATQIKLRVPQCDLIDKIEVVPAGFINVFLNRSFIETQIGTIASKGVQLPHIASKRVIVDFSSPNIAKEMHVGHLRSTIIGDSICRLLEYVGFDVLRVNHIGDWGTQFGMLIAHLYEKYPDFMNQPPLISDLQAFYKRRAYECVVKLQSYDAEIVKAWTMICSISKNYNKIVYDRLDIVTEDVGESFYQKLMVSLVEDLKKKKSEVFREEEGRLLYFPVGCEVPLTIVKSDGGYTYDTSDLAALRYRLHDKKADWVIYVVDAGQSLHFETIFAAGRELGWYNELQQRVEHVAFGLVLGEDRKKFKTRSGDTVRLLDLLDEGVKRAEAKLDEKGRAEVRFMEICVQYEP